MRARAAPRLPAAMPNGKTAQNILTLTKLGLTYDVISYDAGDNRALISQFLIKVFKNHNKCQERKEE